MEASASRCPMLSAALYAAMCASALIRALAVTSYSHYIHSHVDKARSEHKGH